MNQSNNCRLIFREPYKKYILSKLIIRYICISLPFIFCNTISASNIYKWTDNNGQIHYGEKPDKEFNTKTISLNANNSQPQGLITEKPVKIEKYEENGVSKYFLLTNESINKFKRWPIELEINDDKLWLAFNRGVLSFDLLTHQSKKYDLKKLQGYVTTKNMYFSNDEFIFLENNKKTPGSTFHVYNHVTTEYRKWSDKNEYKEILHYENSENMLAIVGTDSKLFLFDDIDKFSEKSSKKTINYVIDKPSKISNSTDSVWHTNTSHIKKSFEKITCSVGYFLKKSLNPIIFDHKQIGIPKSNGCGWIISDDIEVWVTFSTGKYTSAFAVYNIKENTWNSLSISKNGLPVSSSRLQIDSDNLYYYSCENLIALNRETRNSSLFNTGVFDGDDKKTYCINNFKLHKDHLWVFKYERYKYKLTPVLYKIPVKMFDKKVIQYYSD